MNRITFRGLAVGAVIVSAAGLASANVVTNSGFELAISPANGWTNAGAFNSAATLGTITPHSGSAFAGTQFAPRTLYTASMTQVLPLSSGNVVDFGMYYFQLGALASANLTVILDGQTIYTNNVVASTPSWQAVSVTGITINNNNPVLVLQVTGNARSNAWGLDDVTVTPAPGAAALLGFSVLGVTARRRRA